MFVECIANHRETSSILPHRTVRPALTLFISLGVGMATTHAAPTLSVNVAASRHAISDGIYGMNFADEALAADLRLPVRRWGGNSTTRYNWRTDVSNHAADWYFENIPEGNSPNLPNGSTADLFVEQDRRTGTRTLLTMPLIGWTPKTSSPRVHPYDCGFKVSVYGAQQSVDPYDTNCGNGKHTNGSLITGNNPTDTSEAITPTFVTDWIAHLIGRYGNAAAGGVAYYNLDNEPMLWSSTHRDVHPNGTAYNELRDKTYQYAAAVKAADPGSKTLGPVLWGWCAYLYSGADGCGPGADYASHGNTYFVPWYLQQMKLYEQQNGVRILDYLDLHFYPQANGISQGSAGDAATQALRLRTTRSLWDPTYIDESWISDTQQGGVAVQLIPRMKGWVSANYLGTKLAMSEYNFGALDHINGALAQADVLGILGRENFDLATLWGPPTGAQPGAYAFRMFRNYDGSGKRFGDTSVAAISSDQAQLAIYAAERAADRAVTVMVINKTTGDLASSVALSGFTPGSVASVYRYSAVNLGAVVHAPDVNVVGNAVAMTFPASSITLLVIGAAGVAANCVLDIDGDLRLTPDVDGVLLLRYLLGFRNGALTQGVTLAGARNTATAIAAFIGSASSFDVFGRTPPQAMNDGLVLLRILSGMPDAALLNGIAVPVGAQYSTGSTVRGFVNGKCNTQF